MWAMSPFIRRLALLTLVILAFIVYIFLHLNLLDLRQWNNSVQVEVQVLRGGAGVSHLIKQKQDFKKTHHQSNPITLLPPTEPPQDTTFESEFNLFLSTRRLVLLAVHQINDIVARHVKKLRNPVPCSSWWVNPLDVQRNQVVGQTNEYVDYLLEFIATSTYENRTFATIARVQTEPPHDVTILNGSFARSLAPFQRFLLGAGDGKLNGLRQCLSADKRGGSRLSKSEFKELGELCSCDLVSKWAANDDTGLDILTSWPPNSSFLVGDYMNFNDSAAMYNILPAKKNQHCQDSIDILVMISSAPSHDEHRRTIRETYGSRANLDKHKADLVFLFGRVKNETLQKVLEEEATKYGDLIQVNFMDSYHNLSLSHLSMYSYVYHMCSSPDPNSTNSGDVIYNPPGYVFKADDDFLLNLETAKAVAKANPEAELFGCSYCGTPPIHNRAYMTKYYTPRYMYMGDVYPGYLSGVAYLIRGDVLPQFVNAAQSIPFIHMDDTYVTGIIPHTIGIYPRNSNFFGYGRVEPDDGCQLRRMGCSFVLNQTDMRIQWEASVAFGLAMEHGEEFTKKCTLPTDKELKLAVVDDEFKKVCRYT